jgi:membrane associated rhomboid family serine protease
MQTSPAGKAGAEKALRTLPLLTAGAFALCVLVHAAIAGGKGEAWDTGAETPWQAAAEWGYIPAIRIWTGEWWGLITSAFVHVDPLHLAFNLYWFWVLGSAMERSVGSLRWLGFFLLSVWTSSGAQLLTGDTGHGMSGVLYAFFGFGWCARSHLPEFERVLPRQTIQLFILWLGACILLTALGIMSIGNGAHVGGLLFGMLVGQIVVLRQRSRIAAAGLAALVGLATLPAFWCPWNSGWAAAQAMRAAGQEDWEGAIHWHQSADGR